MCVCRMSNHMESRESNTRMLKSVLGGKIRPVTPVLFVSTIMLEQLIYNCFIIFSYVQLEKCCNCFYCNEQTHYIKSQILYTIIIEQRTARYKISSQINHLKDIADIVSDRNAIRFTSCCASEQFSKITSVLNKRMKSLF